MEEKWAVEARMFYNGKVVVRMRKARLGEEDSREETKTCEIWIDIFDSEEEARNFYRDYRR